jgi:hypothetical protein
MATAVKHKGNDDAGQHHGLGYRVGGRPSPRAAMAINTIKTPLPMMLAARILRNRWRAYQQGMQADGRTG